MDAGYLNQMPMCFPQRTNSFSRVSKTCTLVDSRKQQVFFANSETFSLESLKRGLWVDFKKK